MAPFFPVTFTRFHNPDNPYARITGREIAIPNFRNPVGGSYWRIGI
jgi:hypothetical protein